MEVEDDTEPDGHVNIADLSTEPEHR
jgi:hypothetical protein